MVYAVIDTSVKTSEDKLIGYHEKKKVVSKYYHALVKNDNTDKFKLVKCKNKVLKKIPDYYEYYLVRLGHNYIPALYYEYGNEDIATETNDYKYSIEILMRLFEFGNLNEKDKNHIQKTIVILQESINDALESVSSPDLYKERDEMYKRFKDEMNYYSSLDNDFNEKVPYYDFSD